MICKVVGFGNLSWGASFALVRIFGTPRTYVQRLSQKFLQIQNLHRHYFDGCFELSLSQILADCDSRCESSAKTMQNAESALDSAESQNLVKKSNQKFFYKVFASFCFCKKKSPLTPQDSNPPSKVDSMNRRIYAQKLAILNKQ